HGPVGEPEVSGEVAGEIEDSAADDERLAHSRWWCRRDARWRHTTAPGGSAPSGGSRSSPVARAPGRPPPSSRWRPDRLERVRASRWQRPCGRTSGSEEAAGSGGQSEQRRSGGAVADGRGALEVFVGEWVEQVLVPDAPPGRTPFEWMLD